MRIEGQTLPEIFRKMPWQYKVVTTVGFLFVLYAMIEVPLYIKRAKILRLGSGTRQVTVSNSPEQLLGFTDPSLAYDPVEQRIWMAYTSLANNDPRQTHPVVSVRLASVWPVQGCVDWYYRAQSGLPGADAALMAPDGRTVLRTGFWRVETPSLVYDPDDKGREWKLFAYKYFWPQDQKLRVPVMERYGAIVYSHAHTPSDAWSNEQWLFSADEGYPPSPYGDKILLHLNRLDPSLKDVVSYARPSGLYKEGALVLSLTAYTEALSLSRIVMVKSMDHGNSWSYAGVPFSSADLAPFAPDTKLFGASLFEQEGTAYMAVQAGKPTDIMGRRLLVFAFDDLGKGQLQRDAKTGALVLANAPEAPGAGDGYYGLGGLAYTEACGKTYLTTAQEISKNRFRIYAQRGLPAGDHSLPTPTERK